MGSQRYCYWCDRPLTGEGDHLDPCGECSKESFVDLDETWLSVAQKTGITSEYAFYEQTVIFPEIYCGVDAR